MQREPIPVPVPEQILLPDLCLRRPQDGDGPALCAAVTSTLADLRPWMDWAQAETDVEQAEAVVARMQADFAARRELPMLIFERNPDGQLQRVVGATGLHRIDWTLRRFEVGYWRRRGCEGRGVATRAVQAMARLAFDHLGARRVEIRLDSRNWRSARVAEQAGFSYEGTLRQDSLSPDGGVRDTRVYARVRGIEEL